MQSLPQRLGAGGSLGGDPQEHWWGSGKVGEEGEGGSHSTNVDVQDDSVLSWGLPRPGSSGIGGGHASELTPPTRAEGVGIFAIFFPPMVGLRVTGSMAPTPGRAQLERAHRGRVPEPSSRCRKGGGQLSPESSETALYGGPHLPHPVPIRGSRFQHFRFSIHLCIS